MKSRLEYLLENYNDNKVRLKFCEIEIIYDRNDEIINRMVRIKREIASIDTLLSHPQLTVEERFIINCRYLEGSEVKSYEDIVKQYAKEFSLEKVPDKQYIRRRLINKILPKLQRELSKIENIC